MSGLVSDRPSRPDEKRLRVLVVDDSPVARSVLRSILESAPGVEVVGTACNGWEGVQMATQLQPDVITMDVRMPEMDGYEATQQIMAYHPRPILIVTASLAKQDVDFSFRMLEAGALDIFEKPSGDDPEALRGRAQALVERVRLLSRVRVITHLRGRRKVHAPAPIRHIEVKPSIVPLETPGHLVVIGASTGGPRAIQRILARLPGDLAAPVLVIQHIANGFTQGLADWLAGETALRVAVAREGEGLAAGRVYVAPEGRHMVPERKTIQLSATPRTAPIPSVDVTMQAAAHSWGAAAIGVLLTGMGSDGARGLLSIRKAGGTTIAQDQATSTIFGMPHAAIQIEAACKVLPLDEIAAAVQEAVRAPVKETD